MQHYRRLLSACAVLAIASPLWSAPPSIETYTPPIVQRQHTSRLEFIGAGLSTVQEVVFYSPGVRAAQITPIDDYRLIVDVDSTADCAIGKHAFRLRGTDGFSELRTLRVSRLPIVRENDRVSVDSVQELPPGNVTITGTLNAGDYDRYAIELGQGQRLTVEAEAMRLGGQQLDTVLTVYDPSGHPLITRDDDALLQQDPTVSFRATQAGRYIVELRESNYGGDSLSHYALHLGDFPPTAVAYPAGGQRGSVVQIQFRDAHYGTDQDHYLQQLTLPTTDEHFRLFAMDDAGLSPSEVPFRLVDFPNVMESEPNENPAEFSEAVVVPIAFNGLLESAGDVDCFQLQLLAGQNVRLECFADRLGSPLDTYLQVRDSFGNLLAHNDDWNSHDSRLELLVPATGVYELIIRDKLMRGGPKGVYRIEAQLIEPSLTAFLPRPERTSQRDQAIAVARGNRVLARVGVRRDNFEGPIQLQLDQLPNGVHASPVMVAADEFWALVILEAISDAKLGGSLAEVTATGQQNQRIVRGRFEQTIDLVADSADRLYQSATTDRLAVAVTPEMPFSIELEQPGAAIAVGGTLDLQLKIQRQPGFEAPIEIEFPYLPDGVVAEPTLTVAGNVGEVSYRLNATSLAQIGEYRLTATGRVQASDGRARRDAVSSGSDGQSRRESSDWTVWRDRQVATGWIQLNVVDNPAVGHVMGLAAERGGSSRVVCQLKSVADLPQQLTCELEGLPKGVTATVVAFDVSHASAEFKLSVVDDAPVGRFPGVKCRLSGQQHGSSVSYVIVANDELMIAEPGKLVLGDDGQPLTPLQVLRKQNEQL